MNKENGGPAFPEGNFEHKTSGMTLRDYFAAKAMQSYFEPDDLPAQFGFIAKRAYEMADEMLKAREE